MPSQWLSSYTERRLHVRIRGELTDGIVDQAIREIKRARSWKCHVTLRIRSAGGDVVAAEHLSDVIRREGSMIDALVERDCHSAALVVLSAVRGERTATRDSLFTFHQVCSANPTAFNQFGRFTAASARSALMELRRTDRQIVTALASGFAADRAEIEALMIGKGTRLTAQQMWSKGFIHGVVNAA